MERTNKAAGPDKLLFTPGPLTTSAAVKQAMLHDYGSRDGEFIECVGQVREGLLKAAGVEAGHYEAIPMQGSGTFAIEAVLTSTLPPGGRVLILVNGAYGRRMVRICQVHGIDHIAIEFPEDQPVDAGQVATALSADEDVVQVAVVHCETTTGLINPITGIGEVVYRAGREYFVDAMSSFGAVPIDFEAAHIDYLVSSSNKCIEGVPGFGFAIVRRGALEATEGYARTLSLDLLDQWRGLEKNGQFRFTPPTHVILAFRQALAELEQEGGIPGRAARYRANHETLLDGMRAMGFREYLDPALQGHIITSFRYPEDENFDFDTFYAKLNSRGMVIYPGKVSDADCFRIGNIGRLGMEDVRALLDAISEVREEMGFIP